MTSVPPTRLPGFDPEAVPFDPDFTDPQARGTPVRADALLPPALRQRFAAPPAWTPEMRADARLFDPAVEPRPASVLVPLVVRGPHVHVLLTQRTPHLIDHAGQISFPGGRVEQSDADAVASSTNIAPSTTTLSNRSARTPTTRLTTMAAR